jgi:hypothetical protein
MNKKDTVTITMLLMLEKFIQLEGKNTIFLYKKIQEDLLAQ